MGSSTVPEALFPDCCDEVLNSSQSETDITVVVNRKLQVTLIHIRTERLDTHCLAFVHQLRDIGNVGQTSAHDSRHVFRRVVRFQIGCLISYP